MHTWRDYRSGSNGTDWTEQDYILQAGPPVQKWRHRSMSVKYPILITEDPIEGGYTVSIPDLPGCITCCQRWEDIPAMIKDAKQAWITAAIEEGIRIPEPTDIDKVEV